MNFNCLFYGIYSVILDSKNIFILTGLKKKYFVIKSIYYSAGCSAGSIANAGVLGF